MIHPITTTHSCGHVMHYSDPEGSQAEPVFREEQSSEPCPNCRIAQQGPVFTFSPSRDRVTAERAFSIKKRLQSRGYHFSNGSSWVKRISPKIGYRAELAWILKHETWEVFGSIEVPGAQRQNQQWFSPATVMKRVNLRSSQEPK